jgi:hypothetical protein
MTDDDGAARTAYRDKLRTIGVISTRSGPTVREGRRPDGVRVKATTDESGTTTTEHATRDDRVDVTIRAPHVRVQATTEEIRSG